MGKESVFQRIKKRAGDLKTDVLAVWFAYRDPRTPWYAKVWLALVAGYAFSPIDLIPDFIPVLGYLDDFILLPLGILIAIKLVPKDVMDESRIKAIDWLEQRRQNPKSLKVTILVILVWITILVVLLRYLLKRFVPGRKKEYVEFWLDKSWWQIV
ncbi:MAG: YkvA family protein [Candidatus Poribacteria bacterium]